jgi:hypothetical protein
MGVRLLLAPQDQVRAYNATMFIYSTTFNVSCVAGVRHVTRSEKFVRVPSNYRQKDKRDDSDGDDWYSRTRRAASDVTDSKYDDMCKPCRSPHLVYTCY